MELTPRMYLIVCPLVMLAGFVDSVAGGGGLISLPAYYLAGLSPYLAAGTNKLSAGIGTLAASGRYLIGGKVDRRAVIPAFLGSLLGSALGTRLALLIPENTIRIMMICVIPLVALVVLRDRKSTGPRPALVPPRLTLPAAGAVGLVVGFYDGLVGPGTGTFLILGFTTVLGMDAVMASGTAKLVNLASNIASLLTYLSRGYVLVGLGIPAAACAIAGNLLGAGMTIRRGTGFIRRMMLAVLALLLAKMVWDVVS